MQSRHFPTWLVEYRTLTIMEELASLDPVVELVPLSQLSPRGPVCEGAGEQGRGPRALSWSRNWFPRNPQVPASNAQLGIVALDETSLSGQIWACGSTRVAQASCQPPRPLLNSLSQCKTCTTVPGCPVSPLPQFCPLLQSPSLFFLGHDSWGDGVRGRGGREKGGILWPQTLKSSFLSNLGVPPGRGNCPLTVPLPFDLIYTDYHGLQQMKQHMGLSFRKYR